MEMWESGLLLLLYIVYLVSLYCMRKTWEDSDESPEECTPLTSSAVKSYDQAPSQDQTKQENQPTSTDGTKQAADAEKGAEQADAVEGAKTPAAASTGDGPEEHDHVSINPNELQQEPNQSNTQSQEHGGDGGDTTATSVQEPSSQQTPAEPQAGDSTTTTSGAGAGTGTGGVSAEDIESKLKALEEERARAGSTVSDRDRTYSMGSDSDGRSRAGSVDDPPPAIYVCMEYVRWPFEFIFKWTIPDVEDERWGGWWCILTFVLSLAYVSILSVATLKCVTQFGKTIGMENSLSGVTLVALGAEVPDTFASMAVAKIGEGPSAVSNCLNSQIINLLVGLGLPYFLRSAVTMTDMQLGSPGGTQSFIGCLLALIVVVFSLSTAVDMWYNGRAKPQLSVCHSWILVVLYVLVVIAIAVWTVLT